MGAAGRTTMSRRGTRAAGVVTKPATTATGSAAPAPPQNAAARNAQSWLHVGAVCSEFYVDVLSGRAGIFDRLPSPFAKGAQGKAGSLRMTPFPNFRP